jgi:hypothetical protein
LFTRPLALATLLASALLALSATSARANTAESGAVGDSASTMTCSAKSQCYRLHGVNVETSILWGVSSISPQVSITNNSRETVRKTCVTAVRGQWDGSSVYTKEHWLPRGNKLKGCITSLRRKAIWGGGDEWSMPDDWACEGVLITVDITAKRYKATGYSWHTACRTGAS